LQQAYFRRITVLKAKERVKSKAKVEHKKLSKAGVWRLKHPNGLGGRILDMKAVMR
jgi:hypothetical protein